VTRKPAVVLSLMLLCGVTSYADNPLAEGTGKDKAASISWITDVQESTLETCSEKGEVAKGRLNTSEKADIAEFLFRIVNEDQDIIRNAPQESKDDSYRGATADAAETAGLACDRAGRKLKDVSPVAPVVKRR